MTARPKLTILWKDPFSDTVLVRSNDGNTTRIPRAHLDIIAPDFELLDETNKVDESAQIEYITGLGLMRKGAKDLHFAPLSVGDLFHTKKGKEGGDSA